MRPAPPDRKLPDPLPPRYVDPSVPAEPWPTSTPQPVQQQPRRSPFRPIRTVFNALIGGAVLVGIAAGVGFWRSGDRFLEGVRIMLTPAPAEPQVDVRSVVVQQLRGASELTTAIFAMEAVVPTKSDRTLAGYVIGSTNLLYIAYGEVRAGVDLAELTAANVQVSGDNSIQITLPPPKILDSKIDLSKSNVFDYSRGFLGLGPDTAPELQEKAQQEALVKIEEAACSEGLLAEANRRAEVTVGQLLATAGFETVTVTTQPPTNSACAAPANSDTVLPGLPVPNLPPEEPGQ
ncbi:MULTISPECIES: DUF4230 domain-containing protein [Cyanophyceae]|uniref:DUF4230 domain-containing protein n=1 Tax=Leptolyngbya subtilissima DQ-A4 TaxID=2933933 RepID=A0ABV0K986_9CYAN|nr:DUF4230 domain-containing protein [Nodosilinea sp. FACHB-141]MBD2114042.1 DUF4230 domain-containing protein [Nodosilinea sp. FACHB-141]